MMTNDNNNTNNNNIVENQNDLDKNTTMTLEEQTKIAEIEEQSNAEKDLQKTILGYKRVVQRLRDEEGFEVDEYAEEKRLAHIQALENETVKEDVQRRFNEWKDSWKDVTKRKVKAKKVATFCAAFFRTFILVGLCFVILTPFIEKFSYAFRAPQDISNNQVIWIPENWSVKNIQIAFRFLTNTKDDAYQNIAFLQSISTFFNSALLSAVTTIIQVLATAIAGYAFARLKFKGSNLIFLLIILTLIVPQESLQTARKLFFVNTSFFGIDLIRNGLAIYIMSAFGMGLRSAIFIYLFRQFFRGVPIELEESAEIDGAGVLRTFWSVMLPNARGAIVTVALFSFVWQYNDLYWAQIFEYAEKDVMPLLTTQLADGSESFNSVIATNFSELISEMGEGIASNPQFYSLILNTSALLMMLPLIIGYLFVQKLFVESIERTGITGM